MSGAISKKWLGPVAVAMVLVGAAVYFANSQKTTTPTKAPAEERVQQGNVSKYEDIHVGKEADQSKKVVEVVITKNGFEPKEVVVSMKQLVRFVNKDEREHIIEAVNGVWGPLKLKPGQSSVLSFDYIGSYVFIDKLNKDNPFFRGELTVSE